MNSVKEKIFPKDIKTLMEAGFLCKQGELTALGRGRIRALILENKEFYARFVKEAESYLKQLKEG